MVKHTTDKLCANSTAHSCKNSTMYTLNYTRKYIDFTYEDNFVETGPVVGRVSDVSLFQTSSLLQNSITRQKHHSKRMYDSKRQCKIAGFLVGKTRDVSTAPLVRVLTNLVTSYYRRPFTIRKKRSLLIYTVFHFA